MYQVVRETWRTASSGAVAEVLPIASGPMAPRGQSGARAIYDSLRSRIIDGTLTPGQRLTELQLAEQFGASRPPLRAALAALAAESLLAELPTGGIRVAPLDIAEARRVYEIRSRLEGLLARDACERAMPSDGVHLRRLVAAMGGATYDVDEVLHLDAQFHARIEEMADNHWCSMLLGQIAGQVLRYRTFSARENPGLTQHIDGHLAIAESMSGHDPDAAERAVQEHLDRCARRTMQALRFASYQPTGAVPLTRAGLVGRHRRL